MGAAALRMVLNMRFFGCLDGDDEVELVELREVSVRATPDTLRKMAAFLLHAAEQMDRHGEAFGHEHFQDFDLTQPSIPDLVVVGEGWA